LTAIHRLTPAKAIAGLTADGVVPMAANELATLLMLVIMPARLGTPVWTLFLACVTYVFAAASPAGGVYVTEVHVGLPAVLA